MMFRAYAELFRIKPIWLILSMVLFAHLFALKETGLPFSVTAALLLLSTTGLANGAVFALNQYYERHGDAKMERTKSRPIPSGQIKAETARLYGYSFFAIALLLQFIFINANTAVATFLCGGLYVWTYTPLKSRSNLSTLIGSLPGAMLPFIGWFSVTQGFDLMIIWMATMIFLWQIPHTFTIVFRHRDEFIAAGGQQLPLSVGETASFRQVVWYTAVNIPLILIPAVFKVSGGLYVIIAILLTSLAVFYALRFCTRRDEHSAKVFFRYMLSYLPVLFVFMALDRVA